MGEMADMYKEYEYTYGVDEEELDDLREEDLASRKVWPARTGEISISAMSNDHLENALNYIKENNPKSLLRAVIEEEIAKRNNPNSHRASRIELDLRAWAVRQKSTGKYLPARSNGRGYSFDEPSFAFPRLHKSKRSAQSALTAWLQGQWKNEWHSRYSEWDAEDYQAASPEKVEGRNPDDMEIVEFVLFEVEKAEEKK